MPKGALQMCKFSCKLEINREVNPEINKKDLDFLGTSTPVTSMDHNDSFTDYSPIDYLPSYCTR